TELPGHTGPVNSVAWSPDGHLATSDNSGITRVWTVAERRVLTLLRISGQAISCCWSRDGRLLALGCTNGLILLDFLTT
ncbi:WD40 repeat domain-containing protein, partial [Streptomyces phaeochromogenes]